MDLAFFGVQKVQIFMLVLARTAGIFTLVPIFGSSQVPKQVRLAVAVGMAMVFVPFCSAGVTGILATDVLPMLLLVLKEALVGLLIGFVTSLVFAVVQAAGDLMDMQSGFAFASMMDPVYGTQTAIAGRLHHILAGLLFFVTNAHHIMISALADSFNIVPLGELSINAAVAGGAVELFTTLFTVAIRIAAPVVAAVFLADVALGIICRTVPQMNILMVGFPVKLGVGIVGMIIALPIVAAMTGNLFGDIDVNTANLLRLLAAH